MAGPDYVKPDPRKRSLIMVVSMQVETVSPLCVCCMSVHGGIRTVCESCFLPDRRVNQHNRTLISGFWLGRQRSGTSLLFSKV